MWKNPSPGGNGTEPRTVTAWKKIDQRMDRALQDVELTLTHIRNNTDVANLVKHKNKERPGIMDQWMAFRDSGGQSNETDDVINRLRSSSNCSLSSSAGASSVSPTPTSLSQNTSIAQTSRVITRPQSTTSVCNLPLDSLTPISSSRICGFRVGTLKANKLRWPVAVNKDSGCVEVVVPENVCIKQPTRLKKESKLQFSSQIAVPNETNTLLNRLMISGTFTGNYLDNITVNGLTFNAFKANDSRAG